MPQRSLSQPKYHLLLQTFNETPDEAAYGVVILRENSLVIPRGGFLQAFNGSPDEAAYRMAIREDSLVTPLQASDASPDEAVYFRMVIPRVNPLVIFRSSFPQTFNESPDEAADRMVILRENSLVIIRGSLLLTFGVCVSVCKKSPDVVAYYTMTIPRESTMNSLVILRSGFRQTFNESPGLSFCDSSARGRRGSSAWCRGTGSRPSRSWRGSAHGSAARTRCRKTAPT